MRSMWLYCLSLMMIMQVTLMGQSSNNERTTTVRLIADLSTANEVPAVTNAEGSGMSEVLINLRRMAPQPGVDVDQDDDDFLNDVLDFANPFDGDGGDNGNGNGDMNNVGRFAEVTSATVEFRVNLNVGQSETVNAMHIHRGVAGENGPVVVDSQFGGPLNANSGSTNLSRTVEVTDATTLDVIREILRNPRDFYVNIHTDSNAPGFVRGQLRLAEEFENTRTDRQLNILRSQVDGIDTRLREMDTRLQLLVENMNRVARALNVVPATAANVQAGN